MRPAEPERWPYAFRASARSLENGIVAAAELIGDVLAAEEHQTAMRIGVVPDHMTAIRNFGDQAGIFRCVLAQDEKCCRNFVFLQQSEKPRRDFRIRTIIEGQSAAVSNIPNDPAPQLRLWVKGPPGGCAADSYRRQENVYHIHERILAVGAVCDRAYFVEFKEKRAVTDRAYNANHLANPVGGKSGFTKAAGRPSAFKIASAAR